MTDDLLFEGPEGSPDTLVLAHGAGAPMDSPFLQRVAPGWPGTGSGRALRISRTWRAPGEGRRGSAGPRARAASAWKEVADGSGRRPAAVVGGKSLGGRIASWSPTSSAPAASCASATRSILPVTPRGCAPRTWPICGRRRSSCRAPATPSARGRTSPATACPMRSACTGSRGRPLLQTARSLRPHRAAERVRGDRRRRGVRGRAPGRLTGRFNSGGSARKAAREIRGRCPRRVPRRTRASGAPARRRAAASAATRGFHRFRGRAARAREAPRSRWRRRRRAGRAPCGVPAHGVESETRGQGLLFGRRQQGEDRLEHVEALLPGPRRRRPSRGRLTGRARTARGPPRAVRTARARGEGGREGSHRLSGRRPRS